MLEILSVGRPTKLPSLVTSGYSPVAKSSATSSLSPPPTLLGEDFALLNFSNRNNLPNDEPVIQAEFIKLCRRRHIMVLPRPALLLLVVWGRVPDSDFRGQKRLKLRDLLARSTNSFCCFFLIPILSKNRPETKFIHGRYILNSTKTPVNFEKFRPVRLKHGNLRT